MEITVTITAVITVPEGSVVGNEESPRAIVLPDGQWVKPFMVLELNDVSDLTHKETVALDCDIEETTCDIEEAA